MGVSEGIMFFSSYSFLLFFPLVLILANVLPAKWKNPMLLIASYFFYSCWSKRYCVLLLGCTVVVYIAARLLEKKRWTFWAGLLIILGVLFVFKYGDFSLYTLEKILGRQIPRLYLVVPVGISFFTFQAAGYLMDVYRGKYKTETNFINFALFVSFFPQLLSGPIGRGGSLLPQYADPQKPGYDDLRSGLLTMTWGFFLKLMIADRAAILVDKVYGSFESFPGSCLIFATVIYGVQIYCDFAGYSAMAIGAARMLGIRLPVNFKTPYFAQSIQEFWRRWHISLSTWFRDYVYFPLGGSRCAKWKTYRNVLIVFLLSGLWHGANWTFVIWGGLHGLYQIVGKLTKAPRQALTAKLGIRQEACSWKIFRMILTFLLVDFAWLFFRASSLETAVQMLQHIVSDLRPLELWDTIRWTTLGLDGPDQWVLLLSILFMTGLDIARYCGVNLQTVYLRQNWLTRELLLAGFMLLIFIFGIWGNGFDASNFIYFQF